MRKLILILAVALLAAPTAGLAGLDKDDIPPGSTWYFHIDFKEMRESKAGSQLYAWLEREAFDEVREETDVDLSVELDRVSAFDAGESGPVIVMDGNISEDSQDKLMAAAALHGDLQSFKAKGKPFYFISDFDEGEHSHDGDDDRGSFDDGAYFSFAVKNKVIVTPSRAQMEAMLANGGKINGSRGAGNALLVLSAETNLLQAGANASKLSQGESDWDSNILQNTKQLAVLIADVGDRIALDATLVTTAPDVADSLASIARGLISLAAFSSDMEPDVAELLRATKVDVDGEQLQISLAMDPEELVNMLEH